MLVVPQPMLVSLAAKLLSTPTVAGLPMEAALSPERTPLKSIAQQHTTVGMSLSQWSLLTSLTASSFKLVMLLDLRILSAFTSSLTALSNMAELMMIWPKLSKRISASAPERLCKNSTSRDQSIKKQRVSDISERTTPTSPGRHPRRISSLTERFNRRPTIGIKWY